MAPQRNGFDNIDGASAPKVEHVPIGILRPNPRNARTHSKKQIRLIKASIEKFGQIKPVIADDNNMILAGHGFVEAARLAGLSRVAVIRFGHLTETQKRAYLLADNRIAEQAGWDREILAIELGELSELMPVEGFDVSLTGFETAEIDLLLADMIQPKQVPEDDVPPLPRNPVTQRGDLWLFGKHRLLCGDAQLSDNFRRLMNGASAAAVFCDPPFNRRMSAIGGRGQIQHPEFAFASGEMSPARFRKFLSETLGNAVRVSAGGAVHFVCMDWRHIEILIEVGRELYEAMLNLVVWNKSNAGQGSFYRSQHELIGVFRVGGRPHRNNVELGRFGRNRSNVWTYAGVNTFGRDRMKDLASHPTVKPVALVADALLDCTERGDVVLDQFAGSGTIFLAAEKIGRTACGMEYEPRYVDVAIQRWQSLTKLEATLECDGRTFEEIAEVRKNREVAAPIHSAAAIQKAQPGRLAKRKKAAPDGRRVPTKRSSGSSGRGHA
ncbi:DNA methyltransferase [Nitrobacter sp.]|uniref:site-specific DNA-methyltransferase n=1 Tax=Nitrobacter sp. TaxID=29420 RepID=UPI0029CAB8E3|nr:DNA methyltransferase [Nitrobacter sp.]